MTTRKHAEDRPIPTTAEVRDCYAMSGAGLDFKREAAARRDDFGRWLAEHVAACDEVKRLRGIVDAVLAAHVDLSSRGKALGDRPGNGSNHALRNEGRGEGYREAARLIEGALLTTARHGA